MYPSLVDFISIISSKGKTIVLAGLWFTAMPKEKNPLFKVMRFHEWGDDHVSSIGHSRQSSYTLSLKINLAKMQLGWLRGDINIWRKIIIWWRKNQESGRIQALLNQKFLAGLKNHSQWKWKKKKNPRRWRVHQLDNKSNASNSVWYTSSAYSAWTPSVRFTLSLPAWLGHNNLNNSQTLPQFDSESPCSESKGASHPCFGPSEGGGKERPRGQGEPGVSGL